MVVKLGGTGLEVSDIGLGCMGMTAFYGPPMEDDAAFELLRGVHELGYTHFDTAEVYRSKEPEKFNEAVIGKFLQTLPRESFTVATKYFPAAHEDGKVTPEIVTAAFEASLERLGVGYVDLYYCHRMPKEAADLEVWMTTVKSLVEAGKVKHIGLSEASPDQIRKACSIHPVACVQQEWSLLTRNCEDTVVPACKELSVGIVAYSPLARNLLCPVEEQPSDWRAGHPRYQGENWEKNKELSAKIAALGESKGKTAPQLSMAWLYQKAKSLEVAMIPIPGTTKLGHAKDNLGGVGMELSEAEMRDLEDLGSLVAGARANEAYQGMSLEGQLGQL